MTKITPEAQEVVDRLHAKAVEKRELKYIIRKELKALEERRMGEINIQISVLASQALRMGVPKTAIGQALGTRDWGTVDKALHPTSNPATAALPSAGSVSMVSEPAIASALMPEVPWIITASKKLQEGFLKISVYVDKDGSQRMQPVEREYTREAGDHYTSPKMRIDLSVFELNLEEEGQLDIFSFEIVTTMKAAGLVEKVSFYGPVMPNWYDQPQDDELKIFGDFNPPNADPSSDEYKYWMEAGGEEV